MAALSTFAIVTALTAASLYQTGQAKRGQHAQERGLEEQQKAQDQALAQERSVARRNEMDIAASRRKTPDISAILAASQGNIKPATSLSGIGGAKPAAQSLGKTTLLGG